MLSEKNTGANDVPARFARRRVLEADTCKWSLVAGRWLLRCCWRRTDQDAPQFAIAAAHHDAAVGGMYRQCIRPPGDTRQAPSYFDRVGVDDTNSTIRTADGQSGAVGIPSCVQRGGSCFAKRTMRPMVGCQKRTVRSALAEATIASR